ncbi:Uma2 family endonuclease [uncultured Microscilla sp.]|uniref:Uma2 family endonuclease n=1 Tax=uncultured Microscilla sp. TaxID=432653 RepID=UPI00262CA8AE|nr:Uma2 family endonuclease [uncultured Microscilla sp.]
MGEPKIEQTGCTLDEYTAIETSTNTRYEYYKGEIFAMAGTTVAHNEITFNTTAVLKRKSDCKTFMENVKLEVNKGVFYTYPDVMVTCDKRDQEDTLIQRYPVFIAEVLSQSTREYDRDTKLWKYRQIPSLMHYLLVDQYAHSAELFSRQTQDAQIWTYQAFADLEDTIHLSALNLQIKLSELYEGVTLTEKKEKE